MKKILLIVLVILLSLCGCKNNKTEDIKLNDLVLLYHSCDVEGKYISIYSNREAIIEYYMYDAFKEIQISEDEYNEIIDYVFSDKFLNLNELSSIEYYENGMCKEEYVALYYNNKEFITNGDSNKKVYNELINKLKKI